jgi:spoIIIJ-associated protein
VEWVNITAKSLPEAIDLALDNLGVDEAEAEIEVLEEPRQGLFGRLRGNARVRARVKPKGTRPKVERGRARKRRPEGGPTGGSTEAVGVASTSSGSRASGSGGGARSGSRTRSRNDGPGARDDEGASSSARSDDRARSEDRPRTIEGRGGSSRSGGRSRGEEGGSANGRSSNGQRRDREPVEEARVEEVTAHLETFLAGLTEAFGFDGSVRVSADEDEGLLGMVEGRHGLMVGPRARTLDAIQELARVSVQRSAPSSVRIKVDVGGYREMRKAALRKFALDAAAAVRVDGKERSLEPMSSADRKVIHDTLSEEQGIETRSAGNEPSRRVVVMAGGGSSGASGGSSSGEADEIGDTLIENRSLNGALDADAADEVEELLVTAEDDDDDDDDGDSTNEDDDEEEED